MKLLFNIALFLFTCNQIQASGLETLEYLNHCNRDMQIFRMNNNKISYNKVEHDALHVITNPNPNIKNDAKIQAEQFDVCRRIIQQAVIADKNKGKSSTVLAIANNSALHNDAGYKHFAILSILYMGAWYVNDNPALYFQNDISSSFYKNDISSSFYKNRLSYFDKYIKVMNTKLYDKVRSYISNFSHSNFEYIMGSKFIAHSADLSRNYPDVSENTQRYIGVSDYVMERVVNYKRIDNGFMIFSDVKRNNKYVLIMNQLQHWHYKGLESVVRHRLTNDPTHDLIYVTYDEYKRHSHDYLSKLPDELVMQILEYLTGKNFAHLASSCKILKEISTDKNLYLDFEKQDSFLNNPWQNLSHKANRINNHFYALEDKFLCYAYSLLPELFESHYGVYNMLNAFNVKSYRITIGQYKSAKPFNYDLYYPTIKLSRTLISMINQLLNVANDYLKNDNKYQDQIHLNIAKILLYFYKLRDDNEISISTEYSEIYTTYESVQKSFVKRCNDLDNSIVLSGELLNHIGLVLYFNGQKDLACENLKLSINKGNTSAISLLNFINIHSDIKSSYGDNPRRSNHNLLYQDSTWSPNFNRWFHLNGNEYLRLEQVLNIFLKTQYWNTSRNIDSLNDAIVELKENMFDSIKNKPRTHEADNYSSDSYNYWSIVSKVLNALSYDKRLNVINRLEQLIYQQNASGSMSEYIATKFCDRRNVEAGQIMYKRGEYYLQQNDRDSARSCFDDASYTGNQDAANYLEALILQYEINAY